ncbi:hypothetical protein, partial [Nodularia spumigena]|uniref:hypothetical protein n=1 Tax=Nodularia spumigena TaxID=70799 RepID=UPI002B1FB588
MGLHAPDLNSNASIQSNEGWNLITNPFDRAITIGDVVTALESGSGASLNNSVYVWSHNLQQYQTFPSTSDSLLAPFQGFWVKSETILANPSNVNVSLSAVSSNESKGLRKVDSNSENPFLTIRFKSTTQ